MGHLLGDVSAADVDSTPPRGGELDPQPSPEITRILSGFKNPKLLPISEEAIPSTVPVMTYSSTAQLNPLSSLNVSLPPIGIYSGKSSAGPGGTVENEGLEGQESSSKVLSKKANPFDS